MKRILNILVLILLVNPLWAQKATVDVSPKSFLIGEPVVLTVQLQNAPKEVLWPKLTDSTEAYKIDVLDAGVVDTIKGDAQNGITYVQKLKITTFDTSNVMILPMAFYGLDSTLIAISDSLQLNVSTVPVDTTKAFMDIFDPLDERLQFSEILPWILLGAGILLVIGLGLLIYFRKKKNKPLFNLMKTKELTPDEYAIFALQKLKDKRLWQQGLVKEYYVELTDIVRLYVSQRFEIDAMEMLTSEIVEYLTAGNKVAKNVPSLKEMLVTADLVKFAKESPLPNDNDRFLNIAFEFVNSTIGLVSNNGSETPKTQDENK